MPRLSMMTYASSVASRSRSSEPLASALAGRAHIERRRVKAVSAEIVFLMGYTPSRGS